MWACPVLPGGDDRVEGEPVGAELVERPLEPPRDLGLRSPDQPLLCECLVDGVRNGAGAADQFDLTGILDDSQALHEAARRHELCAAGADRLPLGVSDPRRFEADASTREQLAEGTGDVSSRLDDLDTLHRPGSVEIAEIGVEPGRPVGLDEQGAVGAPESGEIADVRTVRDEERLAEEGCKALEATHGRLSFSRSSASR